jgi:hypothetical protein
MGSCGHRCHSPHTTAGMSDSGMSACVRGNGDAKAYLAANGDVKAYLAGNADVKAYLASSSLRTPPMKSARKSTRSGVLFQS